MSFEVIHHLIHFICHGTQATRIGTDFNLNWILLTGLGPILADSPCLPKETLTTDMRNALLANELHAKVMFKQQHDALYDILTHCQQQNLSVTLLKGQSLVSQYYPKPWFRLMRDMDLLVSSECIENLTQILFELGYHQESQWQESYYDDHHHIMPFYHAEKGIWVEVHTRLFRLDNPLSKLECFSLESIRRETHWLTQDQFRLGHLSAELNLVYLCCHWADEFKPIGGLNIFMDISYLLSRQAVDWHKIQPWLEHPLVAVSTYMVLSYLRKLGCDKISRQQLDWIRQRHAFITAGRIKAMHYLLDQYYIAGKPANRLFSSYNLSIIWDSLIYYHNRYAIPTLIWHLIFPPSSAERYNASNVFRRLKSFFRG